MKRLKKRKRLWIFLILIVLLSGYIIFELYRSQNMLQVSELEISTDKITKPIRIVQLSDNHNNVFGKNNSRLIELVRTEEPDIILITGDLINSNERSTDIAIDLIMSLCKIAPVYISLGNHEVEYKDNFGIDVSQLFEKAGATVFDYKYQDISIANQQIRLGGIYGYCIPAKFLETMEADPVECAFLSDFQETDLYTILMCHMPVCWIDNDGIDEWDIDLVLAGHAHGGQIRIPFIGGLWAPDQGWFPGKESGLYYSLDGTKTLILSRGLGSNEKLPRFNNTPEIVVVDLIPE